MRSDTTPRGCGLHWPLAATVLQGKGLHRAEAPRGFIICIPLITAALPEGLSCQERSILQAAG